MPSFIVPDTLRNWPYPRQINPHYETCNAERVAWAESFKAFSPASQKAFNACKLNLLAALAYPQHDKDAFRVDCDTMTLFFVFDEHSDVSTHAAVREQADIIIDALRNPDKPRPEGEWIGGRIAQDMWLNARKTASKACQKRFIQRFVEYTDSVVDEARHRNHDRIRSIEKHFELRRLTVGALPSFALLEYDTEFPDEVVQHPTVNWLTNAAADMVWIDNDLYSYNVEQSRDADDHNLVTVVMDEYGVDLQSAIDWIVDYHDQLGEIFIQTVKQVPSFGSAELDRQVADYITGMANWVRANETWSFESGRYFGNEGLELQKSRRFELLPKAPHWYQAPKETEPARPENPTRPAITASC